MKKIKKLCVSIIASGTLIINVVVGGTAFAATNEEFRDYDAMIETLVLNGYTKDTAEALEYEDIVQVYKSIVTGLEVSTSTCTIEIDNLENIENFLTYDNDQLLDIGFTQEEIDDTEELLAEILTLEDEQLEKKLGLDEVEVKLLRIAEENAEVNKNCEDYCEKEITNEVVSSGSISSSKLTYTQTTVKNSNSLPNYTVRVSYSWTTPYALAVLKDRIVIAWGGNLNCKNYTGSSAYYMQNQTMTQWYGGYVTSKPMSVEITPNAGIQLIISQNAGIGTNGNWLKTKCGTAKVDLYQTKKQGYDTTVISNYCHRSVQVGGTGISISASGPSVSISIGAGWDKSAQKSSIIQY